MDDDDDSYGFGSFSDLFDGAPRAAGHTSSSTTSSLASSAAATTLAPFTAAATPATSLAPGKELDLRAMRQFWVTERALTDFQARLKHQSDAQSRGIGVGKDAQDKELSAKEYHHVAAKFDGLTIEGGLGSAFFTTLSDTHGDCGLLWIQAHRSDSNAQEKRKQELQDITNQRSAYEESDGEKSSSAIFIRVADMVAAQPKTIQHTVPGITFQLGSICECNRSRRVISGDSSVDGVGILEAFKLSDEEGNCDYAREFGQGKNSSVPADGVAKLYSSTRSPAKAHRGSVVSRYISANRDAVRSNKAGSNESKAVDEPVDFRATIRKYLSLDEGSDEAIRLARKVHSTSGYHLGPLSKQLPKFDADPVYKREAVGQLSKFLDRMNQEWKENEERRVVHTKAKCVSQNDLFEYFDVDSGKRVLPHEYKERFLQYVKARDVDPIIRLLPAPTATASTDANCSSKQSTRTEKQTSIVVTKPTRSSASMNILSSVIGIDLTTSCIVDDTFLTTYKPSIDDILDDKNSASFSEESRRALQEAQADLRKSWNSALSRYYQTKEKIILQQTKERNDGATANTATTSTSRAQISTAMRKRARDRRKSIIQPNPLSSLTDLQNSRAVSTATNESGQEAAHVSDEGVAVGGSVKRRRSAQEANTSDVSTHSIRRKSRRQSIVGVVDISLTDEKAIQETSSSTPLADRKSPRRRHSPTTTRSNEENEADGVSRASSGDGTDARICPWDRELATK
ncbi:hypothetical protein FI667_g4555, partial [Globisporangium splendens]